jgi:hypothetical protein
MVSARSDGTALERVLAVLLAQPSITATDTDISIFRACFCEAGVDCASDFMSIAPFNCKAVCFSVIKDGTDKDATLDITQVKKLASFALWFRQIIALPAAKWFELTEDAFRSWRTQPIAPVHAPDSAAWSFKAVNDHQGPLQTSDRRCKGSSCDVLAHWEDGSETCEPANSVFLFPRSERMLSLSTLQMETRNGNSPWKPRLVKLMNATPFATWERGDLRLVIIKRFECTLFVMSNMTCG